MSFLPGVAQDLAALLIDPRLGNCDSALESGPLLMDPSRTEMIAAIKEAFRTADDTGSTLVLAIIGHGIAIDDDFYFLPRDGGGQGDPDEDVHLSHWLKAELRKAANLDGLLVLLDTCYAGVGATQAAQWREVGLGRHQRRYELLTASANQPAYGGKVTKALIDVLRQGIPSAGTTVDARYLREPLLKAAGEQHPQRITHDGGDWAQSGDGGLWWAHNAAYDVTSGGAGGRGAVWDRLVELTSHLQPTPVLGELVAATTATPRVALVGPRGSGKSTLAAALAHPEASRGQVPNQFVQAIVFASRTSTLADLAHSLAAQLTETVPGFADAQHRFLRRLTSEERQGLDALHENVIGPLELVDPPPAVRLVIDALDELPAVTRHSTLHTLGAAHDGLHLVVTARSGFPSPAGSHHVSTERASDETISAYLRDRGVSQEHFPALVRQTAGSWLHAHLLADRVLRPGFDPAVLRDDVRLSLSALYDGELIAVGADDPTVWREQLRPVLGVLAVAGAGPILPLPLLVAASRHLHGPSTTTQVRDVLVRVSGLITRTQPGQPDEHVGLFHPSLAEDYLLRPRVGQFAIEPAEYHAALAGAIQGLAPLQQHNPTDSIHRYAIRAEAHHRWYASHDSTAVIESLVERLAGSAMDARERWQPWPAIFSAALGPEHPDTLTVQESLSWWIGEAGGPAAARDQLTALLPVYEKVFGPEHPDTLNVRASLARWIGEAGDPVAARHWFATLLPACEKVFGAKHPHTLTIRGSLARWTGEAGDPAAARDQYATLLPMRQKVSGPESSETLDVRANLAAWMGQAGDPAAARDQFTALLPAYEEKFGPDSSVTLTARASLARWTGQAGDPAAARDQLATLLSAYKERFGPEHPNTLAAQAEFTRWIGEAGDPAAARDQLTALLQVYEKVFSPDHLHPLYLRLSLARWTGRAGDPAAARDQLTALLLAYEERFGPQHPNTLAVRADLARWIGEAGDPAAARDELAALLPIYEKVCSPEHIYTLNVRADLARWIGESGDPVTARDQLTALLPIYEKVFSAEHSYTLTARASLAQWVGEAGDPAAARDQLAALLQVREKVSGPQHSYTLTARASLAQWVGEAGDPAAARDQLAALLQVYQKLFCSDHPHTVTARASLARWAKAAE
ncbi:tetratricopeptide repeat protein [Streptomyces sp. NPDC005728]|uniref:tetratricopeptide repeat protein n=1 Tax=Streptomyces sp. NPDC005728 TaxID=3157054 RepID=UPI0033C9E7B5